MVSLHHNQIVSRKRVKVKRSTRKTPTTNNVIGEPQPRPQQPRPFYNFLSPTPENLKEKCEVRVWLNQDLFVIKKDLEASDVGDLSSLLLRKELVEQHVLAYWRSEEKAKVETRDGVRVSVYDCEYGTRHELTLTRWSSNNSYVLESFWKEFVDRRKLKIGDRIGLYWDNLGSRFCFSLINQAGI